MNVASNRAAKGGRRNRLAWAVFLILYQHSKRVPAWYRGHLDRVAGYEGVVRRFERWRPPVTLWQVLIGIPDLDAATDPRACPDGTEEAGMWRPLYPSDTAPPINVRNGGE